MQAETVRNDVPLGLLDIGWSDGSRQQFSHGFLREQCRCADCKALRLHSSEAIAASTQTRIAEIRPVGAYGVQFVFSDGHDRGIYPWVYLQTLAGENISETD